MINIVDFPKIKCPFIRLNAKDNFGRERYLITPELDPEYKWLFDKGVRAVDKLHGTNVCVHIQDSFLQGIDNRMNEVLRSCNIPIKGNSLKFLMGVMAACNKGWMEADGSHYGELIGPDINGNLHEVDNYLFVPFTYLQARCNWQSWIQDKYPKNFDSISEWFKELPSLFSNRVVKKKVLAEGLIFVHPDGRMCKIRRDMFSWFDGKDHKE